MLVVMGSTSSLVSARNSAAATLPFARRRADDSSWSFQRKLAVALACAAASWALVIWAVPLIL
ncbi:hypothetical protein D2V17_05775 [Aurantiacibacter xanthus]|uniref:Uncharacterized protein n=2 Tax=Aurantiacibacter xanthus TaxID=1784712 RepID=A0A3A1P795_9SPHN|nr:hypothetical protein D2V17_05775 [Aurantiacibacter xanthus]